MSVLDLTTLLNPIAGDSPCGKDLSYDPAYTTVLKDAEGTPERQTGESIIPAEDPHWPSVRSTSLELFGQSKDLRLALLLALSCMQTDGLQGLAGGLRLTADLLGNHWANAFPRLDPEDNNDPTERANIVSALAVPPSTFGDTYRFQERVSRVPLCASPQLGRFSLADMRLSAGDQTPASGQIVHEPSVIEAALTDTPLDALQATRAAAQECLDASKAIENAFLTHAGPGAGPSLGTFRALFVDITKRLDSHLSSRMGSGAAEGAATDQDASGGSGAKGVSGQIRNAEDVRRALDLICQYYERHEPSSPIPILLRRAQRLVSRSFLDIIRDMSPEALDKLSTISGENLNPPG